jgi:GNAT superfamily N-acetyltransferase
LIDVETILELIRELAEYEKALDSVLATEQTLLSSLSFAPNFGSGYAKTLLIFPNGSPDAKCAGMALFFTNYSTWRAAPGVYLEDLYVRPGARRKGYGKRLLCELAAETEKIGGKRLEWSVLKWNEPSLKFYDSLGAQRMNEWVGMRTEGEALRKLAEGAGGAV